MINKKGSLIKGNNALFSYYKTKELIKTFFSFDKSIVVIKPS